uniref:Uncharacterized protein n=1 Tax=Anguilla anguilla TaxID=7936 RepID=A0A0E9S4F9_ANGAN
MEMEHWMQWNGISSEDLEQRCKTESQGGRPVCGFLWFPLQSAANLRP